MHTVFSDITGYLSAFIGSSSYLYVVDSDDCFLGANDLFADFFSVTVTELQADPDWRGRPEWRIVDGGPWPESAAGLVRRPLVTESGGRGRILWQHLPLADAHGSLNGVLGVGVDLGLVNAVDVDGENQWEMTFNAISDIITIQDEDMRILRCNRAACEQLGLSHEDIVGRHCFEIFRGLDTPCPMCPEIKTIRTHAPHFGEIEHANLRRRYLVSSFPIFKGSGEFAGIIHVARDITAQKSLESQLRQAQKMEAIGTLAGGIAHDFNNILGAILGYADLAMLEVGDGPMRENLEEIRTAGLRAKDLVAQILSFSRQGESVRKPLILVPVIKETLKLLRATLPSTITITQDISCENGRIMADPTQIHQVLMNLCTNAYHAMRDHRDPRLIVAVSAETIEEPLVGIIDTIAIGRYLVLTVADNGIGMDEYVLERAFEPFYTTKSKGEGTGMGLSVVHGIINTYGGGVVVESAPGAGTTVKVYFPRIDQPGEAEAVEKVATMPARGGGRVLLVDDEDSLAQMGKRMLDYLGYEVTVRTSSVEALELFRSRSADFDLLLTDQTMPNMTGLELCRRILEIRPEMPALICTGFSEVLTDEIVAKAGIRKLLMKPLAIHDLGDAVAAALEPVNKMAGK